MSPCHQVDNKNGVFMECRLHFKGLKGQRKLPSVNYWSGREWNGEHEWVAFRVQKRPQCRSYTVYPHTPTFFGCRIIKTDRSERWYFTRTEWDQTYSLLILDLHHSSTSRLCFHSLRMTKYEQCVRNYSPILYVTPLLLVFFFQTWTPDDERHTSLAPRPIIKLDETLDAWWWLLRGTFGRAAFP